MSCGSNPSAAWSKIRFSSPKIAGPFSETWAPTADRAPVDPVADDRVGPDRHPLPENGSLRDDGGGMDRHSRHGRSTRTERSSASATRVSSTEAVARHLTDPRPPGDGSSLDPQLVTGHRVAGICDRSTPERYTSLRSFSGTTPSSPIPATWAIASTRRTPGMTGLPGKWPWKNSSLNVTFFRPTTLLPRFDSRGSGRRGGTDTCAGGSAGCRGSRARPRRAPSSPLLARRLRACATIERAVSGRRRSSHAREGHPGAGWGRPVDGRAIRDAGRDARLSAGLHAPRRSPGAVPSADLSGEDRLVTHVVDPARPPAAEDDVPADVAVVADLTRSSILRPVADPASSRGWPGRAGVRADLGVGADLDTVPTWGTFQVPRGRPRRTRSRRPDDRARLKNTAGASDRRRQGRAGMQPQAPSPTGRRRRRTTPAADPGTRAHARSGGHGRARSHRDPLASRGVVCTKAPRATPGRADGGGTEALQPPGEREPTARRRPRGLAAREGAADRARAGRRRGSPAASDPRRASATQERSRGPAASSGATPVSGPGVALDAAVDRRRDLGERKAGRRRRGTPRPALPRIGRFERATARRLPLPGEVARASSSEPAPAAAAGLAAAAGMATVVLNTLRTSSVTSTASSA